MDRDVKEYAVFRGETFKCFVRNINEFKEYVKSKHSGAKYVNGGVTVEDVRTNDIFQMGTYIVETVSSDIENPKFELIVVKKTYGREDSIIPYFSSRISVIENMCTWVIHPVYQDDDSDAGERGLSTAIRSELNTLSMPDIPQRELKCKPSLPPPPEVIYKEIRYVNMSEPSRSTNESSTYSTREDSSSSDDTSSNETSSDDSSSDSFSDTGSSSDESSGESSETTSDLSSSSDESVEESTEESDEESAEVTLDPPSSSDEESEPEPEQIPEVRVIRHGMIIRPKRPARPPSRISRISRVPGMTRMSSAPRTSSASRTPSAPGVPRAPRAPRTRVARRGVRVVESPVIPSTIPEEPKQPEQIYASRIPKESKMEEEDPYVPVATAPAAPATLVAHPMEDGEARYVCFTQQDSRYEHVHNIVTRQIKFATLKESNILIVCFDVQSKSIYDIMYPEATIKLVGSFDRAAKYMNGIYDEIKERYIESLDSEYKFVVLDLISSDVTESMNYDRLCSETVATKLMEHSGLCHMGFVINCGLPESRYLTAHVMATDLTDRQINGIVFNPNYVQFKRMHSNEAEIAIAHRLQSITRNMFTIYSNFVRTADVDRDQFDSMICELQSSGSDDSLFVNVPKCKIAKFGIDEETSITATNAIIQVGNEETQNVMTYQPRTGMGRNYARRY